MVKRHLTLKEVWDTRTQSFQRKQSSKRTKVSTSGDTSVEVTHNQLKEEFVEKTLATYLFKRITLMVAYAKVGSGLVMPPYFLSPQGPGLGHCPPRPCPLRHRYGSRARMSRNEASGPSHSRVMKKRNQAWDPPEKGSIINNNFVKGGGKVKDGDKHKVPTPPTPDWKMRGVKLEAIHGKPKELMKTNAAGRKYCDICIAEGDGWNKQRKDLHVCAAQKNGNLCRTCA